MAGEVDALFFFSIAVHVFFTALICVLILFFAVKYRRGSRASRANPVTNSHLIEALWIGIPFVIAMVLFTWSAVVFFRLYRPPANAPVVYILGRQWMWEARHPEGKREINELHLPLNQPVRLLMTSEDVIHSYFVPAFRVKQDVLPGRYTEEWFQPTKTGRYHLFCAEYCGTEHSKMIGWVVVMEPAEYQEWLEGGTTSASMAAEGEALFRRLGCSGCHGLNATVRAPLLDGVYGKPVPLQDGRIVTADERYVRDSVLLPRKEIAAGYKPVMPTFEGQIKEAELLKIIAYIKSLGQKDKVER